jgi:hypothetical protein
MWASASVWLSVGANRAPPQVDRRVAHVPPNLLSGSYYGPVSEAIHVVTPQDRARVGAQSAQTLVELNVGRGWDREDKELSVSNQLAVGDPLVLPEYGSIASADADERGMLGVG